MIVEFSVSNYRSIREEVTLSMVASKISSKDKRLDESNTFEASDRLTLLKSAAIYGANASGKSNLIEALRFMRSFVRNSSKDTQAGEPINIEYFRLSEETVEKPSLFQVVFILDDTRYRYGFEVSQEKVVSEWLFYVPTAREAKLFVRDENGISLSSAFKEGRGVEDKTRDNALFLSVVAQFNGSISRKILGWFKMLRVYSGIYPRRNYDYTTSLLENAKHFDTVVQLIRKLDLGFDTVHIETAPRDLTPLLAEDVEVPEELEGVIEKLKNVVKELNTLTKTDEINRKTIKTVHQKYNKEGQVVSNELFDLERNESDGTKKLFTWAGALVDTLRNGKVLIIDEFDRSLHPLISCALIKLFNSNETNPKNAQLIFTTHDTNLLSNKIFRRDQIWFTEKDRYGGTHLYSLVEYKVRNDASFESDYIHGKYGAIPFIGDLRRLIGELDD